jgi:hypothetical protein
MRGSRYSDEQVAQVCHAANAALQAVQEPDGGTAPSGPWMSEGPERMRIVVDGVRNARRGITPRQHHDNWVAEMRKLGWTYGPKDPAARTHPNLKNYDELSQCQRDKDRLFLAIVTALTLTD